MSVTVTVLSATPDMLRLQAAASGGGSATLHQAALAALCVPGPLKSLITSPLFQAPTVAGATGVPSQPGVTSWTLLDSDARLSIYTSGVGPTAVIGTHTFQFNSPNNDLVFATSGDGVVIFELNYRHTINR